MNADIPILEIAGLSIGYAWKNGVKEVFSSITARALRGELIALMGRNGMGKSTLLRCITGMLKPLKGRLELEGKDLNTCPRRQLARTIGFVSTDPVHVQHMKVADLVDLGRFPHRNWMGTFTANDRQLVWQAIESVGLAHLANSNIHEISDGERQRAMIARTLAQDTDLIVLDEPTAYLDLVNRYEIIHLLHRLARKKNKCIIFSSHDWHLATAEADLIWLMDEAGWLSGAPEDLAMNGSFSRLLGSENMHYDARTGQVRLKREKNITVSVEGQKGSVFWTRKALERSGCRITGRDPEWTIKVTGEGEGRRWKMISGGRFHVASSLYEVLHYLR